MIVDKIENLENYSAVVPYTREILNFLRSPGFKQLPLGRHEVPGSPDCYVLIQQYTTKPAAEGKWESHRRYIDIHLVVSGEEAAEWLPDEFLPAADGVYDSEADATVYASRNEGSTLHMAAGWFAVFHPADAHIPCCALREPAAVRKIVVKVPVGKK